MQHDGCLLIKKVKSKRFKQGYGYQVRIDRRGLRLKRTFESLKTARDVEAALLGDRVRHQFHLPVESRVKLKDLVTRHLSEMVKRGRDRLNTKRAETVLTTFLSLAGPGRMVESIRTSDLQAYASHRLSKKGSKNKSISPQTINREMNEIKACLTSAARYYASLEDYRSPKGAWLEEPRDGRRETWSDEEIERVLSELRAPRRKSECSTHVRGRLAVADMFLIALSTGMRAGEVRKLKRSDINFARRVITITSKKGMNVRRSAHTREIPITEGVEAILRARLNGSKSEYLFPGKTPHRPLSSHVKTFQNACERAGINYGRDAGLIFNDARRTAENNMLDAGHQARAVGDVLGHSAETMARHYARSTQETRLAAVESAGNFCGILGVEDNTLRDSSDESDDQQKPKARATSK